MSELQGGKFGHGFVSAGITETLSPAISQVGGSGMKGIGTRAAISAALGGTVSKISGGNFANGAATAAFQSLFNASVHRGDDPRSRENFSDEKEQALWGMKDRAYDILSKAPGPDGVVDLSMAEFGQLMDYEAAHTQMSSELRGGYENLPARETLWAARYADSLFYGPDFGGVSYRVAWPGHASIGPYKGGDFNYTKQGMVFRASGDSIAEMRGTIRIWNGSGAGTYRNTAQRVMLGEIGYHYYGIRNGQ